MNCSSLQSPLSSSSGSKYDIYCDKNFIDGQPALQTDSNGNHLVIADVVSLVSYSLNDCLLACGRLNAKASQWSREPGYRCLTVAFSYESAAYNTANHNDGWNDVEGNCWLKNGTVNSVDANDSVGGWITAQMINPPSQ